MRTENRGGLASMDESYTEEYEDYGYEGGMGDMGYEVSLGLGSGHGQQEDISNRGECHVINDVKILQCILIQCSISMSQLLVNFIL